jgi:hypothetical protein
MTNHFLAKVPILGKFVDERFLEHRRRSTSVAGIAGALIALVFFEYRVFHDHIISWDLFAVIFVMAAVKISMMLWYRFKD